MFARVTYWASVEMLSHPLCCCLLSIKFQKDSTSIVNQHQQAHHEGWMDDKWSGNSFLLDSSSLVNHGGLAQLLFLYYLLTTDKQAGLLVGSKSSLYLCINYKPSTYLIVTYFFYLSTYIWDLFPTEFVTEFVTKVKPNINSVEVHPSSVPPWPSKSKRGC
jgi:hypothetical protein